MSFSHSHFDCPVCGLAEKEIQFYGFSYCNHPVCGVCAIKLKKFSKEIGNDYDYSKCVICKQDISKIILASCIKPFESFDQNNLLTNSQYELLFENVEAELFYKNLIKIKCQKCKMPFNTIEELISQHMDVHKMRYCELCLTFNKCLHYEMEIYTDNDYHYHRNKKHPKCKFCDLRFYDDCYLIKHVKDKHFVCDICHRNHGPVAYSSQSELLRHYSKDHFVCEICRSNNNINVFESEYNLKTHKVSVHSLSLVGEGLVTVGFGDHRDNPRFGSRRRQRDDNGGFFADSSAASEANEIIPQILPTINCEQEFPRLGADSAAAPNLQLGVPSLTIDLNDARIAFETTDTNKSIPISTAAASLQANVTTVTASSRQDKMSDNIAIMVKRSVGSLNSEDFPSLSSSVPTGTSRMVPVKSSKSVRSVLQASNRATQPINCPAVVQEDFPSLPSKSTKSRSTGQVISQSAWKPATGKSGSHAKRDAIASGEDEVDSDVIARVAVAAVEEERSKISIVNRQVTNISQPVRSHQPVPELAEFDFPSLAGNTASTNQSSVSWAKSERSAPTTIAKQQSASKFIIDSNADFPGLPAAHQCNKHKKSKSGFAKVAANAASIKPSTALSATANHTHVVNHVPVSKATAKSDLQLVYEHAAPKTSASLRGIDYIPSVAPVKDPLLVVDSKQFSILKQAKDSSAVSGGGGSHFGASVGSNITDNNKEDFPSMPNRYNDLSTSDMPYVANGDKKSKNSTKVMPRITSESDFPTLAPSKPATQHNKKSSVTMTTEKPKPSINRSETTRQQHPVVSLMDVAMSVAQKSYTPLVDADKRNQNMFTLVTDSLNADMATQFLQLANQYRTRKLSVRDYLESLQGDSFSGQIEFISHMLPEMCVLLPDIPLQRSLMSSMPKAWIKDLRQCTKCDQVLHKTDLAPHNQVAH